MKIGIGRYRVEVATDFGPRVTGLALDGGPELFARLDPDRGLTYGDGSFYRFHGGHRLWAAPEVAEITYAADDHACEVTASGDEVTITAPVDAVGLVKEITVSATPGGDSLVVEHRLTHRGDPMDAAPWAITQLPLGGTAVLPVGPGGDGSQADRSLVLWGYTGLDDPRISWRRDCVLMDAADGPAFKLGSGPAPRRIGYLRDGALFVKDVPPAAGRRHVDRGAVAQVYVGQGFCELETLGGLHHLEEGDVAVHRETWTVLSCPDPDEAVGLVTAETP